ncbi:MAG: hemerythrin family protein [Candidatus Thiodiazotropha endolucinida]|nr:hemerythrin family protein [Candidatus Thiodiazotropha taylori]MCG8092706.1 hemerythrin family protein [Candidatus Thiodiazotropha endolucinida]MCG8059447.1 hemerythrin family protein [Candidatus Thiodiazotropha taylori]MCG8063501.1 hemerythrin family protein [Candidatus Thiodiazotropha taylori]MCW4329585.1 hemerythrin family protein [Candidatus Thiodiazotropha endolucinida]
MTLLIDPDNPRYYLEFDSMDKTHLEFIELVNKLGSADREAFKTLFEQLVAHTNAHFKAENKLMYESGFPAIREHIGEHERILGDLNRMEMRVASGNILLPRAYVKDHLPGWFDLHAQTMDSALAAHLKTQPQNTNRIDS